MSDEIPRTATFRRAEGTHFTLDLCTDPDAVSALAERPGGGTRVVLERDEAALVCRMDRWQRADELGVEFDTLAQLCDADLLFWSSERPDRELCASGFTGDPERSWALRRNASVTPRVRRANAGDDEGERDSDDEDEDTRAGECEDFPFMPRRGELDDAALVGFSFALLEYDEPTYSVAIECCAKHGAALRALLPRLSGRERGADLLADPVLGPIARAMGELGLLEHRADAPAIPPRDATTVTWLCHAGVLYQHGATRLLVDPLEYPYSAHSRRAESPPDFRDLAPVDAVLITHADNDHLNPRTLCRLASSTPVFIPAAASEEPYQVDTHALLRVLGFTDVRELRPWERATVGEVTVVATPFRGEDWGLTLATQCFVLHGPALTVYLNADSTSTPDAYARIRAEFAVDLALLGVTGASEAHVMPARYGYGHFYAPWIPPARRNEWVRLCNGPRESAEVARLLAPRFAFGYAAGGADFAAQAYVDRGTHAEFARALRDAGCATEPLELPLGRAVKIP